MGLALAVVVILIAYRAEFASPVRCKWKARGARESLVDGKAIWLRWECSVMFFAGWPVPKVAVVAGALLLVTRRVNPEQDLSPYRLGTVGDVRGLFIVIAGVEKTSSKKI